MLCCQPPRQLGQCLRLQPRSQALPGGRTERLSQDMLSIISALDACVHSAHVQAKTFVARPIASPSFCERAFCSMQVKKLYVSFDPPEKAAPEQSRLLSHEQRGGCH